MADTLTEQIIAAVVTALDGAGKPAGLTVTRSRRRPRQESELPALSVYPEQDDPKKALESRHCQVMDRTLTLTVKIWASPGDAPDAEIEPIRAWVATAIMTNVPLQALIIEAEEELTIWQFDDGAEGTFGEADMGWKFRYTTNRTDLTRKS